MTVPNRSDSADSYRYGFQGQEKDDEIKGDGNSLNYKFRMHDPRVGRFFAVDPLFKKYEYNSPYAFSENRVIDGAELEGKEVIVSPILGVSNTPILSTNNGPIISGVTRVSSSSSRLTPRIHPVVETVVKTSAELPNGRPMWLARILRGNSAHREILGRWQRAGWSVEKWLGRVNGKGNRADGIKISRNGKTGTIRELKPNTASGKKAGYNQLSRYINAAQKKFPNVSEWKPELHLYEGTNVSVGLFYSIQKGDNLSDIAKGFDISIEQLMKNNPNINDKNLIKTGEEILIDKLEVSALDFVLDYIKDLKNEFKENKVKNEAKKKRDAYYRSLSKDDWN